jgi:hypothetical protein
VADAEEEIAKAVEKEVEKASASTAGRLERVIRLLSTLSFSNIAIFMLLVVIALPAYAIWKFLQDSDFRSEFFGRVELVEAGVPCIIYQGQLARGTPRTYIFVGYAHDGRMERIIGARTAQGFLPATDLPAACAQVTTAAREATFKFYNTLKQQNEAVEPDHK